jgi:hypothetical protein
VREVARALRLNSVLTSLVAEEWGEALGGDLEGLAALAGALALNRRLTRLSLAGSALQVRGCRDAGAAPHWKGPHQQGHTLCMQYGYQCMYVCCRGAVDDMAW